VITNRPCQSAPATDLALGVRELRGPDWPSQVLSRARMARKGRPAP